MVAEEAYEYSQYDESESEADFNIETVDGPALTHQISGIVGLCITSLLWIIASWRLLYHYSGWCTTCCTKRTKEDEDINHLRADGLTTKRLLHGLLWTAMVVEGVGYADMVGTNSSNKLNYVLLDVIGRGILEFSTFVIGTVHWFNITSQARAGDKKLAFTIFPAILMIITIAVTVSSTFEAVVLLNGGFETVHEFRSKSDVHKIQLLVESTGWGIHAVIVAICGKMVYERISSLPTFSQVRSQAKRNIITKMIIPMIFCSLCYLLRAGWMAADFISRIINPETTFESGVGWWVGNCWVPTFIPSIMLLYSIRKRDRAPGSIDGVPESLLRTTGGEGQTDPFLSFQQTFQDFEDEDASMSSKQ
mmetsp:Transcript_34414/g.63262  ORF Transcript_34414/g.63262 Transcript_34414/m.63262 type:complete len:363 (+) Transcript_34414:32-1120(+)